MPRSSSSSSSSAGDGGTAAAVDAVLAEVADLCALEQVAKLNTAHLSDSSLLPSDLEARFRKLKSFPAMSTNLGIPPPPPSSSRPEKVNVPRILIRSETAPVSRTEGKNSEESIPKANGGEADNFFHPVNREASKKQKSRSNADLGSSPSFSFDSWRESLSLSPSPPKQRCCFGYSPRKVVQRRKGKRDETLSELSVLALKEEHRKLKKALKEQEKLNKESAKMVKWVKQASARMNAEAISEWRSDEEDEELK